MTSTHIEPRPTSPLAGVALLHALADNWWLLLLRGVAAIVFGVLAFMWPLLTLLTLTFLWGAYAIVDGVLALWEAIAGRGGYTGSRFWLACVGIAGIIAWMLGLPWTRLNAVVLFMFIVVLAIVTESI